MQLELDIMWELYLYVGIKSVPVPLKFWKGQLVKSPLYGMDSQQRVTWNKTPESPSCKSDVSFMYHLLSFAFIQEVVTNDDDEDDDADDEQNKSNNKLFVLTRPVTIN